jgi:L-tyrosine peroxygenase
MTATMTPARADAWSFGGYPYALMPLVLPDPGVRCHGEDIGGVVARLELLGTEAAAESDPGPDSPEQLFWFRWIIGNQAVSALWQILDDELGLVLSDEVATAARNAEALLDAYSALLIYAGTPTRDVYHRLIRPAMALQHRSFSGRWAQDYVPVMAKLQSLRSTYRLRSGPEFIDSLIGASRRNHRTHVAVAAKLVPGEDSLLRAHDGQSLGAPTEDTVRLYDAFYSTCRALVPREKVVEQLIDRLRAILRDLRANGLYPAESASQHERPPALWGDELTALEQDMIGILRRAGQAAAAALRPPHGSIPAT